MTTFERKSRVKSNFSGEDIASFFHQEDINDAKKFQNQKSRNSELLAAFRAKKRMQEGDETTLEPIDDFNVPNIEEGATEDEFGHQEQEQKSFFKGGSSKQKNKHTKGKMHQQSNYHPKRKTYSRKYTSSTRPQRKKRY
jgi:hypothetical protein